VSEDKEKVIIHRIIYDELCDGNPQCVLFCPTKALEFREPEAKTVGRRRALAEKLKEVCQLEAVYYQVEPGGENWHPLKLGNLSSN
jgi:ferredoxin